MLFCAWVLSFACLAHRNAFLPHIAICPLFFCQEIVSGEEHISFRTSKIGSLLDINDSKGMAVLHGVQLAGLVYSPVLIDLFIVIWRKRKFVEVKGRGRGGV